jgi:hypothetical protein
MQAISRAHVYGFATAKTNPTIAIIFIVMSLWLDSIIIASV